jgi:hypothetical protein
MHHYGKLNTYNIHKRSNLNNKFLKDQINVLETWWNVQGI